LPLPLPLPRSETHRWAVATWWGGVDHGARGGRTQTVATHTHGRRVLLLSHLRPRRRSLSHLRILRILRIL
jgi:hypothetical protein